jgi:hypothetical protein
VYAWELPSSVVGGHFRCYAAPSLAVGASPPRQPERRQLKRLRRENAELKRTNEIQVGERVFAQEADPAQAVTATGRLRPSLARGLTSVGRSPL